MSFVSVMCFQVEISFVERSPTECGVSECDREASLTRRPSLTRDFAPLVGRLCIKKCYTMYSRTMISRIKKCVLFELAIHSFTVPYMRY